MTRIIGVLAAMLVSANAMADCTMTAQGLVCGALPTCTAPDVWSAVYMRCIPPPPTTAVTSPTGAMTPPSLPCKLSLEWTPSIPEGARLVQVDQSCAGEADLAVLKVLGSLIGAK